MGSVPAPSSIRPLAVDDLAGCVALSRSASWNQNEADWRMMLELGSGWGIERSVDGGSVLAASVIVIPYGTRVAWVSMVLVLPAFRGEGLAKALLQHAIAHLRERGIGAVLDATPAGFPVYTQLGFRPTWGFKRYACAGASSNASGAGTALCSPPSLCSPLSAPSPLSIRPIMDVDWPAVDAIDGPAFGADRSALLRALAHRLPAAARLGERDGRLCGFVFGRAGRQATQIGPLWAADDETALQLLDEALATVPGPVYADLGDHHPTVLAQMTARGFQLQRPFTRMVLDMSLAPGAPGRQVLMAGPELG